MSKEAKVKKANKRVGGAPPADPWAIIPYDTDKSKILQVPAAEAEVVLKHPHSWLMCGKSGSGKTQVILNLLKNPRFYGGRPDPVRPENAGSKYGRGYFDHIFVWSQTAKEGDDLYSKHLRDLIPPENLFEPDEEGMAHLEHIISVQKAAAAAADGDLSLIPRILCLFDDFANCAAFLASPVYLKCHIANRHFNMSCWSAVQSYVKSPRSCRCNVSGVLFFHGATRSEVSRLSDEHTPPDHTAREMKEVVEYATPNKYDFLFVNKQAADQKKGYRRKFGDVINLRH